MADVVNTTNNNDQYSLIQKDNQLYNAFFKQRKGNWNKLNRNFRDQDDFNDQYLKIGENDFVKIKPEDVQESKDGWGTYSVNGTSYILDPTNNIYIKNRLTPTTAGTAFRMNSNSAPVPTVNNSAYTYNEWQNRPWQSYFDDLQSLSSIYGNIDTADEFNIIGKYNGLRDYVNNNYVGADNVKKALFNDQGQFVGTDKDVAGAAALINTYLTTDAKGKEYANQLMRGQATLPMLNKYAAYAATKDWGAAGEDDRNYLNDARNRVDGKYNGARFFMDYAGDKTWGTLANEFARNNRFREDYTVNGKHVMERLNRDAGLGDGRTLIQIYNDIINKNTNLANNDEAKYRIFRDMTRRRFKLDDNFWRKYNLVPFARDNVYGDNNIMFKEGGQIFRMLFV